MQNRGVYKWSFIDRVSLALINFGVNIALARMLTPDDYGLLAMITIFIAIAADLSSCGLSDGLVHKLKPTELDYSTVFVFNAAFGLLFGLLFFFTAPLVASYFGHGELVGIMRILGVCFFFQTMSYVQETRLRKMLKMKSICIARVGATITVSIMGIVAAMLGYGYKALVCTQILLSFFLFLYYTVISRWFPAIGFSRKSFKEFFSYGVHLMLAYFASEIGKNINTFVLGRFYSSPSASGVYYQGAKLAAVPFGVTESSLNNPFFVVASNEADKEKQRRLILEMFRTIIGVNGTIILLLLVVAAPAVIMLYGDKWVASIPIFRILALAEFTFCIRSFFQTICKVHGRTVFVRNMGFAEVAVQLLLLMIFCRQGILWIAWTQVGGVFFSAIIYMIFCRRLIRFGLTDYLLTYVRVLWLPAVAALSSLVVLMLTSSIAPVYSCLLVVVTFAAVFVSVGELAKVPVYLATRKVLLKR
ncbi:MAG: lipopolysaccharide biosynthesis protein [Clostridium sp.]|nr:lipopolysaccharide biosynthesis protein [Clostridium sp.]